MAQSNRPYPVPNVYEICTVCGYDHVHDFPSLAIEDLREAEDRHIRRQSVVPEDVVRARWGHD